MIETIISLMNPTFTVQQKVLNRKLTRYDSHNREKHARHSGSQDKIS